MKIFKWVGYTFPEKSEKIIRIMKISFILCVTLVVSISANTYSQTKRLNINKTNATIAEIFSDIESQSKFSFLFSSKEIDVNQKISISADKVLISDLLETMFSGKDISYHITGNHIVLFKDDLDLKNMMQQGITVTGTITDPSGETMPGVNIIIKGTTTGVVTDTDGNYSIKVPDKSSVLVFSFVGYEKQEFAVGDQTSINVTLKEGSQEIEEVVVVGYSVQKKETLTGAISVIKTDEITTTSGSSLAQKLQGKVSGLNIRQSTGQPGTFENDIRIRGFEDAPLFVIDGIVRGGSEDFQKLSAEDIESISVLKDASAAIYGMNSSNGVIIVTTKRGTKDGTRFTASGSWGFSQPTDLVRMANASEYALLRQEANLNTGRTPFFTEEGMAKWLGQEGTDWYDEVFRKFAQRKEFNISAEGGNEKMSFYVNGGAMDEGSLLRSDDISYNKYNLRANISAKLTENLSANVLFGGFIDKRTQPLNGMFEIWRGTISSLPTHTPYANDNPDYINNVFDGQSYNPIASSNSDVFGYYNNNNTKYNTSLELAYQVPFVEGLEIKGVLAYDGVHHQSKELDRKFNMYDYDVESDTYNPKGYGNGRIQNHYNNNARVTFQAYASYKRTFAGDHDLNATFVYEQKSWNQRWATSRKDFVFFTNAQLNAAVINQNTKVDGIEETTRNIGLIGRIDYGYKDKYLLGLIGRYDGSYRYHPDYRWGFFPVVSAAWRASEEGFIKNNISWLTNLKFRGSIGTVGQDEGSTFQYVSAFTDNGGKYEFANGSLTPGLMSPALVIPGFSWSKNTITNLALEVGFWSKLNLGVELFKKDRKGIPAKRDVSLPNTLGAAFPDENINNRSTKGVEFNFSFNDKIKDFRYSISGNFTAARTMWTHKERGALVSSWDKWKDSHEGGRWDDVVWTYNLMGQFQNYEDIAYAPIQGGGLSNSNILPGDFRYEDVNGDGVINDNDKMPNFTNNTPKINYGLNLNGSWKGLDFNILIQGAAMFSQRYTHAYTTMFWNEANLPAYFMDRWHLADYNEAASQSSTWIPGEWPAMRIEQSGDLSGTMIYEESSAWRRTASYVRLKNIELGYTFDNNFLRNIGVTNLRLYANVNNVFTIADKYIKPFDPERIGSGSDTGWIYPLTRSYNLGLSIQF